jgi:hypothetical protein
MPFSNMNSHNTVLKEKPEELPDTWWYRVYAAVIVTTVLVISLLWAFSRYFTS